MMKFTVLALAVAAQNLAAAPEPTTTVAVESSAATTDPRQLQSDTNILNESLSNPKFQAIVTEILATPELQEKATTVMEALLKSPSLKKIASTACKVVDDGVSLLSLIGGARSGLATGGLSPSFLSDAAWRLREATAGALDGKFTKKQLDKFFSKIGNVLVSTMISILVNNDDPIPTFLGEVMKLLPYAIVFVKKNDPTIITTTVEAILSDKNFIKTAEDVWFKIYSVVGSMVIHYINLLLGVPAIKEGASKVCKVVDDGADIASVFARKLQSEL